MTTLKYTAATLKAQFGPRKAEQEAAAKAQLEKEINETIAKINDAMETATDFPISIEIGLRTEEVGRAVRETLTKAGFYMMSYNPLTGILRISTEQVPAEKNPFAFPN
jgi:hypothetical protein